MVGDSFKQFSSRRAQKATLLQLATQMWDTPESVGAWRLPSVHDGWPRRILQQQETQLDTVLASAKR